MASKDKSPEEILDIKNLQLSPEKEIENDDSNSDTSAESTLFPKISGKVVELIHNYKYIHRIPPPAHERQAVVVAPGTPTLIPLTGTVKLHGTHADIVFENGDEIRIQSRNRLSLQGGVGNDNMGVAQYLIPLRPKLLELRDRVLKRFKELNPETEVLDEHPVIIAGEWVGPGIQKGVALAKLEKKLFVMISIAVNNKWVPDSLYSEIEDEEAGIVNIARGGFFHEVLDIEDSEPCRERMMALTMEVERECPFSKSYGISGVGEGIVWKASPPLGENARMWLKTKGPQHRVSNVDNLTKETSKKGVLEKARMFAKAAVTERRLEQGWEYLGEMGVERNTRAVPVIMKWVADDVLLEEKMAIAELGVEVDVLRKVVGGFAREWFLKRLKEENGGV